jgi:hypothetical protein
VAAVAVGLALLGGASSGREASGATESAPASFGPAPVEAAQVVFDGQSLVNFPKDGHSTATQTGVLLAPTPAVAVAVDGTSYAQRNETFDARLAGVLRATPSVLVDIGGQSDLVAGLPAAAVYDAMVAYHRRARAAGAVLTVASTVPAIGPPWRDLHPGVEQERLALNEMLRSSVDFDAVADLAALPEASDPLDGRYFTEQIHPTAPLAQRFAELLVAAVRTAGQPGVSR